MSAEPAAPAATSAATAPATTGAGRRRRSLSIAAILALAMGLLVGLAVGAVLALTWSSNRANTLDLLNDRAITQTEMMAHRLAGHVEPVARQVDYLSRRVNGDGGYLGDPTRLHELLSGALAATPQVAVIVHADPEGRLIGVDRQAGGAPRPFTDRARSDSPSWAVHGMMRNRAEVTWGPLTYLPETGRSYVNAIAAVRRDDRYAGFIAAAVSVPELSRKLAEVGRRTDTTGFILYGREHVLAHPRLVESHPAIGADSPALRRDALGDPVIAAIWDIEATRMFARAAAAGVTVGRLDLADGRFAVFHRTVRGLGETPWVVGGYAALDTVDTEMRRLFGSLFAGIGVLILAVLAALLVGRAMARPIRRLAAGAARIGSFDLDKVEALPGSRIRELDEQAGAFNAMLGGLRWFETYVPKRLVSRLIDREQSSSIESAERELTVMFTDIAGFTGLSEHLDAGETAALLNHHFALIGACVEAQDGTIDKFIGDAVMAFWGAPDRQDDHADRALTAAQAIREAIGRDNAARRARGEAALRVRIGLHSGPVVVGNIGAPGRINYTIVGDVVNTAQRLESMGREIADAGDVTVLLSARTVERLSRPADLDSLGEVAIRGRRRPLGVCRLI